jgi:hypothetical protein
MNFDERAARRAALSSKFIPKISNASVSHIVVGFLNIVLRFPMAIAIQIGR